MGSKENQSQPDYHKSLVDGWWIIPFFAVGLMLWGLIIWSLTFLVL